MPVLDQDTKLMRSVQYAQMTHIALHDITLTFISVLQLGLNTEPSEPRSNYALQAGISAATSRKPLTYSLYANALVSLLLVIINLEILSSRDSNLQHFNLKVAAGWHILSHLAIAVAAVKQHKNSYRLHIVAALLCLHHGYGIVSHAIKLRYRNQLFDNPRQVASPRPQPLLLDFLSREALLTRRSPTHKHYGLHLTMQLAWHILALLLLVSNQVISTAQLSLFFIPLFCTTTLAGMFPIQIDSLNNIVQSAAQLRH